MILLISCMDRQQKKKWFLEGLAPRVQLNYGLPCICNMDTCFHATGQTAKTSHVRTNLITLKAWSGPSALTGDEDQAKIRSHRQARKLVRDRMNGTRRSKCGPDPSK